MTGLHRLLVNQAGTFLGDALLIAAFPLLAVHVTRSPALISAVGASATLPWVVVGLPSGLAADRWERRRLMASASLLGCLLLLALAAIVGAGHDSVVALAAIAFSVGCTQVLVGNVGSALMPQVVHSGALTSANAKLFVAQQIVGQLAGPPLAGLLIGVALSAPVIAAAACYGLAAAVLLTWQASFRASTNARDRAPIHHELTAGFAKLVRQRQLLTFAVTTAVLNLAIQAVMVVLVLYAVAPGPLGITRAEYGLLLAAFAVGGVAGAPLAPRLARAVGRGRLLTICIPVFPAGLAVPALWPSALATGVAFAAIGAVSCLYNVTTVAFRQRVIPASHLGRVTASYRLLSFGALPLGAALGGLIASQLGVRAVFPIAAAIAMLTALGLPFVRERSLRAAETQAGQATA
jgi:MFS family permease